MRKVLAPAALGIVILFGFWNSFDAGFALDNKGLILDDPRVHAATGDNIGKIFTHTYWWPAGESGLYRPLTTLSYLFNYAVLGNGADPSGYHWINLLLHGVNVVLVWMLARRFWGGQAGRSAPLFLAAVWAVHPVLTESVTNIVGRADLLAGTALLGGFLMYLKSTENRAWLAGLAAISAVGVFSKESAVTIAGVLVLFAIARREFRGLGWGLAAVLPPILGMLWVRGIVLTASAPAVFPYTDNPLVAADFWTRCATGLQVIGRYLALLIWPARLSCDYSFAQIPMTAAGDPVVWLGAAAAAAALVALWRWQRTGFFLTAAAFAVFLPTANLLFPIGATMAERFLYLPSIAFAAGVVWLSYRVAGRYAPVVLIVLIAAYGLRTQARNRDWRDDLTLSASAVRVVPQSFKAHKLRANALFASHAPPDEVIAEADQALVILKPLPDARSDFDMYRRAAEYQFMKGDELRRSRAPESLPAYQRSADLFLRCDAIARAQGGRCPGVDAQLARIYLHLDQPERAMESATRARASDPDNPETYRILAGLLLDANRNREAAEALAEGVRRTHDEGLQHALGDLCAAAGKRPGFESVCSYGPPSSR